MQKKRLPVGIEDFKEIRRGDYYYTDKTGLIRDMLNAGAKVNLFTRPRRFGKTLNMSMLRHFFSLDADPGLFENLEIAGESDLCETHMGKYPVVFMSLKDVEGLTFEDAKKRLKNKIGSEAEVFHFLLESDRLSSNDKDRYCSLIALKNGQYCMEDTVMTAGLEILSRLLYKHCGKRVVLLIDEYDVPLDKAFQYGYYDELASLIRSLFSQALKTNEYLQLAVLTGCLRVSKESIFTGLNNLDVHSIVDVEHDEHFGFTEAEVQDILDYYDLAEKRDVVREWYDGYHFGNADIYCPWDVIKYTRKLLSDRDAEPEAFWINTSGNDLVKRFIDKSDKTTQNEIERLIEGEAIEKSIRLDLTYNEIDSSIDHLWSVLFTTGYLTQEGRASGGVYKLVIPNLEVKQVFVSQIQEWFKSCVAGDEKPVKDLNRAFLNGDAQGIQRQLNVIMSRMISVLDTKASDDQKENFYHGLLLGLLRSEPAWLILSNAESGDGFCDIIIEPENPDAGIVIEVKYARTVAGLDQASENALTQIRDRRYDERLINEGRTDILRYGIAFCKKRCRVRLG